MHRKDRQIDRDYDDSGEYRQADEKCRLQHREKLLDPVVRLVRVVVGDVLEVFLEFTGLLPGRNTYRSSSGDTGTTLETFREGTSLLDSVFHRLDLFFKEDIVHDPRRRLNRLVKCDTGSQ